MNGSQLVKESIRPPPHLGASFPLRVDHILKRLSPLVGSKAEITRVFIVCNFGGKTRRCFQEPCVRFSTFSCLFFSCPFNVFNMQLY